jgi:hypothetical protein
VQTRKAVSLWAKAAALALAASTLAADGPAPPAAEITRVRLSAPFTANTVRHVLARARHRLERPSCQRIYTEFADTTGRPLRDVLEEAGTSGPEHLDTLLFYDGTGMPRCTSGTTLAFTFPRSPIVFICAARFTSTAFQDPLLAEAAVIHESLHALGLGENPPSSSEITGRVMSRCSG